MKQLRKILLVEDNPNDVELTMTALSRSKLANDVVVARDGVEALDYLFRRAAYAGREPENPVVVFLDVKMPKMDGMEVLRQMKEDSELKLIPVVMLTSSREEVDLMRSYQLGANAYVVKPVGFQQFLESVGQLGIFWAILNVPPPVTQP